MHPSVWHSLKWLCFLVDPSLPLPRGEEGAGIWLLCFRNRIFPPSGARQEEGLKLSREVETLIVDHRENLTTSSWLLCGAGRHFCSCRLKAQLNLHAYPSFEPSTSSTLISLDAVHWSSRLTPLFWFALSNWWLVSTVCIDLGSSYSPKVFPSVPYSSPVGR